MVYIYTSLPYPITSFFLANSRTNIIRYDYSTCATSLSKCIYRKCRKQFPFLLRFGWTQTHTWCLRHAGEVICIPCAAHRPDDNRQSTPFHKLQETLHSWICKSHSIFQTYTAKTYKPSRGHEIWMISWWILRTKAPLWLVANIANTDLAVERWLREQNETRLEKTVTEWEWLQGSVTARKLTDNHNVGVDMPNKSN